MATDNINSMLPPHARLAGRLASNFNAKLNNNFNSRLSAKLNARLGITISGVSKLVTEINRPEASVISGKGAIVNTKS